MKKQINSRTLKRVSFYKSPKGQKFSKEIPTYQYKIDKKTGKKELHLFGKTNAYNKIQSHSEETNSLKRIIEAHENGNALPLKELTMRKKGQFLDTTKMPKNIHEANQIKNKADLLWKKLPKEIKKDKNRKEFATKLSASEIQNIIHHYAFGAPPSKQEKKLEKKLEDQKSQKSNEKK